ncbi:MAG TPA: DUF4886 domain-containing protein [bacterium]|jgi:hypothetical protein
MTRWKDEGTNGHSNPHHNKVRIHMQWLGLCLLLFTSTLFAQEATISGRVLRRGVVPMAQAHVRYTGPGNTVYETVTDSAGFYRIEAIPLSVPEQSRPRRGGFVSKVTNSVGASRGFYFVSDKPQGRAQIFDILGRNVASLTLRPQQAADSWINTGFWNGVSAAGVPAANGIYFAVVLGDPEQRALKFIHLRSGSEGPPPLVTGSILQALGAGGERRSRARRTLDDAFTVTLTADSFGGRFAPRTLARDLHDGDNGEVVDTVFSAVPHSILFVGNSYTYFNGGVDVHLRNLLLAAHPDSAPETSSVTVGGYTLGDHWNYDATRAAIASGHWEMVVLQEQSQRPQLEPDSFYYFARLMNGAILNVRAETAFYMTWARQFDPPMIEPLAAAYDSMGRELGAQVAPCGRAFQRVATEDTTIHLYESDGSHPTVWGTYLVCCVFYAALFHESPVGISYVNDPRISDPQRAYLQTVAYETVRAAP